MEKTILIGDKEVRLNNNVGWTMAYRDQFGHDIIPTLMPMVATLIDLVSGLITETGKTEGIEVKDLLKVADSDKLIDAVIHMSGLEFVEFINITWSLAKCSDDNIPEPKIWVREFEEFPVDTIAKEVFPLIAKGLVSSKNFDRLQTILKPMNKSTSTKSFSQDSSEV